MIDGQVPVASQRYRKPDDTLRLCGGAGETPHREAPDRKQGHSGDGRDHRGALPDLDRSRR